MDALKLLLEGADNMWDGQEAAEEAEVELWCSTVDSGSVVRVSVPNDALVLDLQSTIACAKPEWRVHEPSLLGLHLDPKWVAKPFDIYQLCSGHSADTRRITASGSALMLSCATLKEAFRGVGAAWPPPKRVVYVVIDKDSAYGLRSLSFSHKSITLARLVCNPSVFGDPGAESQDITTAAGDEETEHVHQQDDTAEQYTVDYIEASELPPLAHRVSNQTKILVRHCYKVVFDAICKQIRGSLEDTRDSYIVVTGNPGIGKSRFYVYCLAQLANEKWIPSQKAKLIVNFGHHYREYDFGKRALTPIYGKKRLDELMDDPGVIRLVEASSSEAIGWSGVSILFSSPGMEKMRDFTKSSSSTFILPVWDLDELVACNALLREDIRLSDAVLVERFVKYGGCPRFIFVSSEDQCDAELGRALWSFDALRIIRLVASGSGVSDRDYSHRVLQMTPDREDTYAEHYHLDFLSSRIGELVVAQADEDSLATLSAFAVANVGDDSGATAVVRGKISELFGHRHLLHTLKGVFSVRPLSENISSLDIELPPSLKVYPFDFLLDATSFLSEHKDEMFYCRPRAKNFGAVDAFIFDGLKNVCYAFQMTINMNHGIHAVPMKRFIEAMAGLGAKVRMIFVVPSSLEKAFKKQNILTQSGAVHKRPGKLMELCQYVLGIDTFYPRETQPSDHHDQHSS